MGQGLGDAGQNSKHDLNWTDEKLLIPSHQARGFELGENGRISGDLDFTDDDSDDIMSQHEAERKASKGRGAEKAAADAQSTNEVAIELQRTFNENEVIGDFVRDWNGKIKDRDQVLKSTHFRDNEGHAVNEKGYLIDEDNGGIRSKYTFDILFEGD
jgi:hypothetical protein